MTGNLIHRDFADREQSLYTATTATTAVLPTPDAETETDEDGDAGTVARGGRNTCEYANERERIALADRCGYGTEV
ncbi:hypothetical protein C483_14520 [Natrialba hulunbeirensis JCM 10989]|uniref:Uncharacterized protein n=1 Tax=Natrialba hulunbeirensis JCM 10989 TaxID=1227493 RepID=L9ZVI0_9EURY|nr:hypothetical protein C483_14520 [Natrialba hulunbeirensis JCM 10989]